MLPHTVMRACVRTAGDALYFTESYQVHDPIDLGDHTFRVSMFDELIHRVRSFALNFKIAVESQMIKGELRAVVTHQTCFWKNAYTFSVHMAVYVRVAYDPKSNTASPFLGHDAMHTQEFVGEW